MCSSDLNGTEEFFNPMNGRRMTNPVFSGPVFYQRLEKFWSDNFRVVNNGSIDLVSRHISDNGAHRGLRLGDMEKDCIMSIGMPNLWGEKAYDHSHGFTIYFCRRCEEPAIVNHGSKQTEPFYKCKSCGDNTEIVEIPSSWSSKMARQIMNICNTGMKIKIKPFEFNKYLPMDRKEYDESGSDDDDGVTDESDLEDDEDEEDEEFVEEDVVATDEEFEEEDEKNSDPLVTVEE